MDNISLLQVPQCENHLLNDLAHHFFWEPFMFFQHLIQVAVRNVLQYTVNLSIVVKVRIQLRNVWMALQSILYFEFFLHLRVEVVLDQKIFAYGFDGNKCSSFSMLCSIHIPKLAFANLHKVNEVTDFERLALLHV